MKLKQSEKMQKIVIDTNVLVSALIQKSYPYHIINEIFFENFIQLCISDKILEEYYEVLNRDKFSKYHNFVSKVEQLLVDIESNAIKFQPKIKLQLIKDKDDNKFLELADECNADFLITGNTNDFTMQEYKKTKIVTPKDYWEKYKP